MSTNAEQASEAAFTPHVAGLIAAAGKRIDLGRRRVTHYSRDERLIYELVVALSDASSRLEAAEAERDSAWADGYNKAISQRLAASGSIEGNF